MVMLFSFGLKDASRDPSFFSSSSPVAGSPNDFFEDLVGVADLRLKLTAISIIPSTLVPHFHSLHPHEQLVVGVVDLVANNSYNGWIESLLYGRYWDLFSYRIVNSSSWQQYFPSNPSAPSQSSRRLVPSSTKPSSMVAANNTKMESHVQAAKSKI
ncbi:hypothetical protein Ancab_016732 [Ancistrocladus abbreviatus]